MNLFKKFKSWQKKKKELGKGNMTSIYDKSSVAGWKNVNSNLSSFVIVASRVAKLKFWHHLLWYQIYIMLENKFHNNWTYVWNLVADFR